MDNPVKPDQTRSNPINLNPARFLKPHRSSVNGGLVCVFFFIFFEQKETIKPDRVS